VNPREYDIITITNKKTKEVSYDVVIYEMDDFGAFCVVIEQTGFKTEADAISYAERMM